MQRRGLPKLALVNNNASASSIVTLCCCLAAGPRLRDGGVVFCSAGWTPAGRCRPGRLSADSSGLRTTSLYLSHQRCRSRGATWHSCCDRCACSGIAWPAVLNKRDTGCQPLTVCTGIVHRSACMSLSGIATSTTGMLFSGAVQWIRQVITAKCLLFFGEVVQHSVLAVWCRMCVLTVQRLCPASAGAFGAATSTDTAGQRMDPQHFHAWSKQWPALLTFLRNVLSITAWHGLPQMLLPEKCETRSLLLQPEWAWMLAAKLPAQQVRQSCDSCTCAEQCLQMSWHCRGWHWRYLPVHICHCQVASAIASS